MHFGVRYAILTSRAETKEFPRGKFTSGLNTILKTINAFKMPLRIPKCRINELFAFKTFMIQKTVRLNAIRTSLNCLEKCVSHLTEQFSESSKLYNKNLYNKYF